MLYKASCLGLALANQNVALRFVFHCIATYNWHVIDCITLLCLYNQETVPMSPDHSLCRDLGLGTRLVAYLP